jgi:hypothetical protein
LDSVLWRLGGCLDSFLWRLGGCLDSFLWSRIGSWEGNAGVNRTFPGGEGWLIKMKPYVYLRRCSAAKPLLQKNKIPKKDGRELALATDGKSSWSCKSMWIVLLEIWKYFDEHQIIDVEYPEGRKSRPDW